MSLAVESTGPEATAGSNPSRSSASGMSAPVADARRMAQEEGEADDQAEDRVLPEDQRGDADEERRRRARGGPPPGAAGRRTPRTAPLRPPRRPVASPRTATVEVWLPIEPPSPMITGTKASRKRASWNCSWKYCEQQADHQQADDADQERRQAQARDPERALFVEQLAVGGAGQLEQVLGRLLLDDVDDVVDRDDADQAVLVVDHRHREQVVARRLRRRPPPGRCRRAALITDFCMISPSVWAGRESSSWRSEVTPTRWASRSTT